MLAPDTWGELIIGPGAGGRQVVVTGADRVAMSLLRFWGEGSTLVSLWAGNEPALLGFIGRKLAGVLVFVMRADRIAAVQVIVDPHLLETVNSQLPVPA